MSMTDSADVAFDVRLPFRTRDGREVTAFAIGDDWLTGKVGGNKRKWWGSGRCENGRAGFDLVNVAADRPSHVEPADNPVWDGGTWQTIDTAPKDQTILVFGKPDDIEGVRFRSPAVLTAYWDDIDQSFCLSGATWLGPFIRPTHWMPLPNPPETSP